MTSLDTLRSDIMDSIAAASSEGELESVRVSTLGKKGSLSALLRSIGTLSPEERSERGPLIHSLKKEVEECLARKRDTLRDEALDKRLASEWMDVTLPVPMAGAGIGRIHPLTQVFDEIVAIFSDMGFDVADGPDIESDDYNFTKLNFPPGHPAREMQDTFFMPPSSDGKPLVLRTHTSPVQIRTMLSQKPPIRVICPGRTYRCDDDQTHTPMFHQVEGLVIDQKAHMGHLKWVLSTFCKRFFGLDKVDLRFRPSFFPFTEPSMEVDVQCDRSGGSLAIGQGSDWLEILGCGMVNPKVLENCDLDPDIYQGFAWGIGIDRLAMLKYGIPDLRAFYDADQRWLTHYGFSPLAMPGAGSSS